MRSVLLSELTWPDVRGLIDSGEIDTAVIAVGATEQHGPHLPLGTDSILAQAIGELVTARLGRALLAPPITIGCSDHHLALAGTISLGQQTLAALLEDYVRSLARHRFKNIVVVPTHGGNFNPLAQIVAQLRQSRPDANIVAYTDLEHFATVLAEASAQFGISAEASGLHSGELETSLVLALRPELVRMDRARTGYLGPAAEALPVFFQQGVVAVSPEGVLGDPRQASPEQGRAYLQRLVEDVVAYVAPRLR